MTINGPCDAPSEMQPTPEAHPSGHAWHAIAISHEPRAREAVEYGLMEAGALGTESRNDAGEFPEVTAYYASLPDVAEIRAAVFDALRIYGLPASTAGEIRHSLVEGRDWLGEWKKSWQPVEVGRRLIIAPPWSAVPDLEDRIVIRIEPGMAFGTGTHETTRLCLEAIEGVSPCDSLLDVGTGTGILAIAAAKIYTSARVTACDIDDDAIGIARENAALNGVAGRIDFRAGTIDDASRAFDCVCANLTADVIVALLPALIGASSRRLILSGILESQIDRVRAPLHAAGINDLVVTAAGEWVAINANTSIARRNTAVPASD